MTHRDSFKDYVLDQLAGLEVSAKAMFGGYGLYVGATFFAILHRDRLYFRTDTVSRDRYTARGMEPFRPSARQTLASYYEVPADILEDGELLTEWARAALAAQPKPAPKRPAGKRRRTRPIQR
jgi:DNA transformation protein